MKISNFAKLQCFGVTKELIVIDTLKKVRNFAKNLEKNPSHFILVKLIKTAEKALF